MKYFDFDVLTWTIPVLGSTAGAIAGWHVAHLNKGGKLWSTLPPAKRTGLVAVWSMFVLCWLYGATGPGYFRRQGTYDFGMVHATLSAGRNAFNHQDYARAVVYYSDAIRQYKAMPTNDPAGRQRDLATTYTERGRAYFLAGDFDNAIQDYTEAINLDANIAKRDPQIAEAYLFRSYCFNKKQELAKAEADYRDAMRLNPDLVKRFESTGGR